MWRTKCNVMKTDLPLKFMQTERTEQKSREPSTSTFALTQWNDQLYKKEPMSSKLVLQDQKFRRKQLMLRKLVSRGQQLSTKELVPNKVLPL
mmetsp:Transcript_35140/g.93678  ORF Transcript_35140/g.93678 Transcript_35140/m.93678 type:complete len:92 (+) Transcript_35140:912-1187(+)